MFTGIIEEMGTVQAIQSGQASAVLQIRAQTVLEDTRLGDSIAINGICLTVTALSAHGFSADVMHETLNRSTLGSLRAGDFVNLERAMPANGRFGGHIVSGHVDGVGKITQLQRDDNAIWYTIETPPALLRHIVEKGSIAVDGISLTVAQVTAQDFAISAIPHTVRQTILQHRKPGDSVNLETDVIGKYVERLLEPITPAPPTSHITREFLSRYGF
ncbi:MAG: riboflavin synthase [Eubacteriales bacterium]|jgi:riboflavin synthase